MEEALSNIYEELSCKHCAALLEFTPGTKDLVCQYCGTENVIASSADQIQELDFYTYKEKVAGQRRSIDISLVRCDSCGAQTQLPPEVIAEDCSFCGNSLMIDGATKCTIIEPQALLPFSVPKEEAFKEFRAWVNSLWFAPNALKKYAAVDNQLKGIYVPYWTYDCQTESEYEGLRGKHYTTQERTTVMVDGRPKSVMRSKTRTKWYPASGHQSIFFDDVLIVGTTTLYKETLEAISPFDLKNLTPFNEHYLRGFRTECYQIDLESGFKEAKYKIDNRINSAVRRDIGGDAQRIHYINTDYSGITFKHVLLPIWISSYQYKGKVYQFLINGRTGKVKGDRPYSKIKIALLVLFIAIVIFVIVFLNR